MIGEGMMPRTIIRSAVGRRRVKRKVPQTFRLTPDKVAAAQRILGTATATETIETALDMIVFRKKLVTGTAAMLGVKLTRPDRDRA
jgi:hypothetical protein